MVQFRVLLVFIATGFSSLRWRFRRQIYLRKQSGLFCIAVCITLVKVLSAKDGLPSAPLLAEARFLRARSYMLVPPAHCACVQCVQSTRNCWYVFHIVKSKKRRVIYQYTTVSTPFRLGRRNVGSSSLAVTAVTTRGEGGRGILRRGVGCAYGWVRWAA